MNKEKIFLSGVGGMLGEAFYKVFSKKYEIKCTDIDVNEDWLEYLDFRDPKEYISQVEKFNPNYLFHIGAFTDLEYCEKNKTDTFKTNTESVKTAVSISNKLSIPLLYISTAGIFDGLKNSYDESDTPKPMGIYAQSKYDAEKFVLENSKQFLICRAGWMMGGGPKKDKKFIQKLMKQIKDDKKEIFVVDDKFGTPTFTHDFAKNVQLLIENKSWGLYNMVCEGNTSRYEVSEEILKILDLQDKIKLTKVNSDYFSKIYFAKRPACENLINKELNKKKLNLMRPWKITLKEYLKTSYSLYL
ncbi:sugar nucleotide-binding protein [Candidatus Pelagibacter sp.]|nr:sugar nucleotide-binding protein [Candidatus Pelagibacter sp.]|tara:strand:+ start:909 stop:1811 length:903 start_codon:yes stop_codon:yes gene_type:complete